MAQQEEIYPAMPEPVRKCPQCNKDMVLKTKKSGGLVSGSPSRDWDHS
jgi:DNA topoisomerase-3